MERQQYIDELARLSPIDYMGKVAEAMKELGLTRRADLDKCVGAARKALKTAAAEAKAAQEAEKHPERQLNIGSDSEIAHLVSDDLMRHAQETGELYFYTEGVFYCWKSKKWEEQDDDLFKDEFITNPYDGAYYGSKDHPSRIRFNRNKTDSVFQYLITRMENAEFFDPKLKPSGINLNNGFVSFNEAGEVQLEPHHPMQRARHVLDGDYDPGWGISTDSLLGRFLSTMWAGDPEAEIKTRLIQEMAGAALLGSNKELLPQPKAIVMIGRDANNGKSAFLDMLEGLVGEGACSHVGAHQFSEMNIAIQMRGKLLNTSSELTSAHAIAGNIFKKAITNEHIDGKILYRDVVQFCPQAQHIFACNRLPPFVGGIDKGCRRRLLLLEFLNSIPEENMVKDIAGKIVRHEYNSLLNWAIRGAERLIRQQGFSTPVSSVNALDKWVHDTDSVIAWIEERVKTTTDQRTSYTPKTAYDYYYVWAEGNHIQRQFIIAKPEFENRMKSRFPGCRRTADSKRWTGIEIADKDPDDLPDVHAEPSKRDDLLYSFISSAADIE